MPEVAVDMSEYKFTFIQPPAGRVLLDVRNRGTLEHRLTIADLPDDFPPIDAQLRGSERRILPLFGRDKTLAPGGTDFVVIDFQPRHRYAFVCYIADPDGVIHGVKGMNTEFTAVSTSASSPP